jgi:hypothetical protein
VYASLGTTVGTDPLQHVSSGLRGTSPPQQAKTLEKPEKPKKPKEIVQYRKSLSDGCNAISCQIFRFFVFLGFCEGFCIASAVVLQYRMVWQIKRNDQIVFV